MDGNVLHWIRFVNWREKYDAVGYSGWISLAGVVGPTGHGVAEQFNAYGRVDIFTGTLGKSILGQWRIYQG